MASTRQSRRLIQLRKDNNLLQSDLARMISELSHRKEGISVPAISSWETGRRTPSLEMINILSSIYQVTPEYIQCLTDDPQGTAYLSKDEAEQILENQHKVEVDLRDIDMFDGKPVFIIFENLVLRIELIEVVLEARPLVRRDARDDLRADDGEETRVDKDGHRQDLPLGLDARAEHDGLVLVLERLRAEHVDVVVHEELLEVEGLRVALDPRLPAAGSAARRLCLFLLSFLVLLPIRCLLRLRGLGFFFFSFCLLGIPLCP